MCGLLCILGAQERGQGWRATFRVLFKATGWMRLPGYIERDEKEFSDLQQLEIGKRRGPHKGNRSGGGQ